MWPQQVKLDGGFLILDARDLSVVHEGRDSKEWITDIKYSPDGTTLAAGSHDSKIYLYDVTGAFAVKGVFSQVSACSAVERMLVSHRLLPCFAAPLAHHSVGLLHG